MITRENTTLISQVQTMLEQFKDNYDNINSQDKTGIMSVFQKNNSVFDKYNAIALWCNRVEEGDPFEIVKRTFNELHHQIFKNRIDDYNKKQEWLVDTLEINSKKRFDDKVKNLEIEIKNNKSILKKLHRASREIISFHLNNSNSYEQQDNLILFNNVYRDIKLLLVSSAVHSAPVERLPCAIHTFLLNQSKKIMCETLDKNIEMYHDNLKKEGIVTKFLKLLSPARWQRWKAIKNYQKDILPIKDYKTKYARSLVWIAEQEGNFKLENETSRFYRNCLATFMGERDQMLFESIPFVCKEHGKKIKQSIKTICHAIEVQNDQVTMLNQFMNHLSSKTAILRGALNELFAQVKSMQDKGQPRQQSDIDALYQKIFTLNEKLIQLEQKKLLQDACEVSIQLVSLDKSASSETINKIKKKVEKFSPSKEAIAVVDSAVDKVIHDTRRYSGKENHFAFMGVSKAQEIVQQLGNPQQKREFQAVRATL